MRVARRCRAALLAGLFLGLPAAVEAAGVRVDYGLWLAGLPLGEADLSTRIDGDRYRAEVKVRLTGLAGAVTGGRGAGTATGSVAEGRPVPSGFAVTTASSSAQRSIRMGLKRGNVADLAITPPLEDTAERVPVTEAHKRAVVDPVSALVMPAPRGGELTDPQLCNRTLPVFDGGARFDIVLSYAETRQAALGGYQGPVLVCNARYVAHAGHRPDKPGTRFMETNRNMSVWLAPVPGERVLVPLRIQVATTVGTSVIEATRWTPGEAPNRQAGAAAPR